MSSEVSPTATVMRTALLFSLGAGLVCTAWIAGLLLSGNDPFGPKRLMVIFVPPLAVIASQWFLRRYFQPEGPGLKRAIGTGLLTAVLSASLSGMGVYGLAQVAGPEEVEKSKAAMLKIAEGSREEFVRRPGGKEQYERTIQGLKAVNAQGLATDDFMKKLLFGLLLSIPGGIFLRK
ncbi:DUF4199 domain-containing protein [Hymenobacter cellulosilyticus]|uniref:DUF4199 domain-containing protein n=1 Tax=Hymenobacter cellulosilyticus TaxID=2932248 RepID=A0A8T9Q773_9BACT|nr:DUF4199 domain-containing protein [Hymenobacter cellulosilyticus]UOQ71878.1 DUF4199 domain-containing protein [Hymenobacter cellulosilyticus]